MGRKSIRRHRQSPIHRAALETLEKRAYLTIPYVDDFGVNNIGEAYDENNNLINGYEGQTGDFWFDFADLDSDTITHAYIRWEDPYSSPPDPGEYAAVTGNHIEGPHYFEDILGSLGRVDIWFKDSNDEYAYESFDVSIQNGPPTYSGLSTSGTVYEGTPNSIHFDDPSDPSPIDASSLRYSFSSTGGLAGSYGGASGTNSATVSHNDNGTFSWQGRIFDKDGAYKTTGIFVTVQNVAPTAYLFNSGAVNPGSKSTVYWASPSDPSSADTSAGFRYSFATSTGALASTYSAASRTPFGEFEFSTPGNHTVYARIFDKDNGYTEDSTTVTVQIPLKGKATDSDEAQLKWKELVTGESSYIVDQSTNGSSWTPVDTLAANSSSDIVSSLSVDTTYYFRVRAVNGSSQTMATSNVITVTTPTYLSDLTFVSSSNGWGPVERDESNGENGSSDGGPITLGAIEYLKGLGVHADSQVVFDLNSGYARFLADIGVDDEVAGGDEDHGSVLFEVKRDNVTGYTSALMTGTSSTKSINLSVTGVDELKLIVDDDGDLSYDHADWADAKLLDPTAIPASPTSIRVNVLSNSAVDVLWNDNSDDETGFEIEYSTDRTFGTGVTMVTANYNEFSKAITGLSTATIYYFRVRSTNSVNDSANSGTAIAATKMNNAPTGLTATRASSSQINLSWTDNSSNELGYIVERSTDDITFTEIQTTAANATSFNDTGLSAGLYYYRVRAFSAVNKSAYSNVAWNSTRTIRNVTDTVYGAIANDGLNDLTGVENAIAASGSNDVIYFPAGTYNFTFNPLTHDGGIYAPGNRTFMGIGANLVGVADRGMIFSSNDDNITFVGLTFTGGGIFVDDTSDDTGSNDNIIIDSNVFDLDTATGLHPNGITSTSGLLNSRISNNYFTGEDHFGIWIQPSFDNLTISNNEFVDIGVGMHVDAAGGGEDLLVEQNSMTGVQGIGFEFQYEIENAIFQDNYFGDPANDSNMAFSLPLDESTGVIIRRNTVLGNNEVLIAFETGGDGTIVEDNYANAVWHVVSNTDLAGSTDVTIRNNRFVNFGKGPQSLQSGMDAFDNGDIELTWDILRPKPTRWYRL